MSNLSWQFYKGYYEGFRDWDNLKSKDERIKKGIESFFKQKNKPFLDYTLEKTEADPKQVQLTTNYPGLLIGSGYTHETGATGELKLGLQLDYTSGLPIIPGSSVKGKLRSLFPQFKAATEKPWMIADIKAENENSKEKAKYIASLLKISKPEDELFIFIHELELMIFEGVNVEESKNKGKLILLSIYERDIFLEAFPIKGGRENKLFGLDSITPHGGIHSLKNPVPLLFLKVLPSVIFEFRFCLRAPAYEGIDAGKRRQLFELILEDTGIGAKTNVGYGQFKTKNNTRESWDGGKKFKENLDKYNNKIKENGNIFDTGNNFIKKTTLQLKEGEIVRAKVAEVGNEIKMQLIDIIDAPGKISIAKNRSIQYRIDDIYEVKIMKAKNKISKIEHTINIKPLSP
jgi:CRISPR-associated protein Cmr6